MANQIKSVAQLVLENKGKETRKRKAEELSFKKSLASSSNSINKTIHDKKVKDSKINKIRAAYASQAKVGLWEGEGQHFLNREGRMAMYQIQKDHPGMNIIQYDGYCTMQKKTA